MTPHNRAEKGDFAKIVLMPGDPLRARFVAEEFMEESRLVTDVRGIYGYTGRYKGIPVSVMASGMGGPSAGIYSYELFTYYDVDSIIRIGTAGGLQKDIKAGCIVLPMSVSTDSNWAHQYSLNGTLGPAPDWGLFRECASCADSMGIDYTAGMVFSSDLFSFYSGLGIEERDKWGRMGAIAQEMETYALYTTALYTQKKALSILTVTINCVTGEEVPEGMRSYSNMITLALETAKKTYGK